MMRARSVSRFCYLHHISKIDPTHTHLCLCLFLSLPLSTRNLPMRFSFSTSTLQPSSIPSSSIPSSLSLLLVDFEIIQAFLAIHKVAADKNNEVVVSRKETRRTQTNETERVSERAKTEGEEGEAVLSGYERGWKGKYIAEKKTDSRQEVCAWGDSRPYRVREKKEVAGVVWKEREK